MIWGANIHRNFALPQTDCLALTKSIGLSSVRVDIYDATADTKSYLTALIAAASPLGISVVPVLVPNGAACNTELNAYNWCRTVARSLALTFPQTTWEAGNELDIFAIKPGTTGELPADYDKARYLCCRGGIKGMWAGFKSASSQPVGVGMAGLHWGFLDRLKADGVQWDITTWHIYTPPGATDIVVGASALFSRLATYGKPIAITEFNQQDGHGISADPTTLLEMMTAIEANAASKNIIAAYFYELLDQPGLSGGEATYGIANANGVLNALGDAVKSRLAP